MKQNIVAIVGRPNVGKSTLFNRLIKRRQAIVDDRPGVTRDRLYAHCTWNNRHFLLIDTGGFIPRPRDDLSIQVTRQVEIAIDQADLILFVLDLVVGIQTLDEQIAARLKRSGKKVLVVANKADNEQLALEAHQFYQLGLGEVYPVSAANGRLVGELLDAIVANLSPMEERQVEGEAVRVAIVGRPNVGKSSLFNAIIGEPRQVVLPKPGTTRDSVDSLVEMDGRMYLFIDTAGLRRKTEFADVIEYYSSVRSLKAIQRADMAIVVLDGGDGVLGQDLRIARQAAEWGKGLIFAVNKWDLTGHLPATQLAETIYRRAVRLRFAPVVCTVATKQIGISELVQTINLIDQQRRQRITTSQLNEFLEVAVAKRHPPAKAGRLIKFNFVTQAEGIPPTFVFFCNYPEYVTADYQRYLENQLRQNFGFLGTPLVLLFRRKRRK